MFNYSNIIRFSKIQLFEYAIGFSDILAVGIIPIVIYIFFF